MKPFSIPTITVLPTEQADLITMSKVTEVTGNGGIQYGGVGAGTRASDRRSIWD